MKQINWDLINNNKKKELFELIHIINKSFFKNFYSPILLLLFPLIVTIISFFTTKNVITFNQTIISIISIDLFAIGFVIIPVYLKIFQNSIISTFNRNSLNLNYKLIFSLFIYFSFISVVSIFYSFIIIALFGISSVNDEIYLISNGTKISSYNDFIFSINSFQSKELGIEKINAHNWLMTFVFLIISYFYYTAFGLLFNYFIKDQSIFYMVIIFISLITIIDGGLLISVENINQYGLYQIVSYLTISIYPIILILSFWLGYNPFISSAKIYSSIDFDFRFDLTTTAFSIVSLSIVLIILALSVILFLIIYLKKNYYLFNIFLTWRKKQEFYDKDTDTCKLNISKKARKNKEININLNLSNHSLILLNKNKKKKIINIIKNKYLFDNPFYIGEDKSDLNSVFIESSVNQIPEINIEWILNYLQDNKNQDDAIKIIDNFHNLLSLINYENNGNHYIEYLLLISYFLCSNCSCIVIELLFIIKNHSAIEYMINLANLNNKKLIFIGDKNVDVGYNLLEIKEIIF